MAPQTRSARSTHIQGVSFEGNDPLSLKDCAALQHSSITDAIENLVPDHNGGIICVTAAHLGANNATVENYSFHTIGELFAAPKVFKSSRFFEMVDHQLVIISINTEFFEFPGSLASKLVDHTSFQYIFRRDNQGQEITAEQAKELGFKGFCLKFYAVPSLETWARYTLVLFPLDKAALLTRFPMAEDPRFPGLQVDVGDCELQPHQGDVLENCNWGAPILPVLLTPSAFVEGGQYPSSAQLRSGLASLLRKAQKPEIKSNPDNLMVRWAELEEQGSSALKDSTPTLLWPLPRVYEPPTLGRPFFIIFLPCICFFPPQGIIFP